MKFTPGIQTLRIVQAFLGDRALTTAGLREELPDVPPASLYRHVGRLVDGGVLSVVAERRVRGALERTYVLRAAAARIGPDEVAKMSREELRAAFLAFVAGLVGCLSSGTCDRRRRAALSRAGQSPLEPLLVMVPGEAHAM